MTQADRLLPTTGAVLLVLCGLGLSWLVVNVPAYMVVAALLGVAFCIVFLQRPDLGLLMILLVRATSDVSVWLMGAVTETGAGFRTVLLTPNAALILMLVLCGSLYLVHRRVPFISLPGGILLTLLQLTGLVAMTHVPSIPLSLDAWLAVTSTIVVYALAAHVFQSPDRIQRVIDVLAVSFIAPAVFGFSQLLAGGHDYGGDPGAAALRVVRVQGTFVHPSAFGFYLVPIFSIFLTQVLCQTGLRRLVAFLIVGASAVLIAETYTRAAWAGALVVLLTVGVLGRRAVLVSALIGLIAVNALAPSLVERVKLQSSAQYSTLEGRFGIWEGALREWQSDTAVDGSTFATVLNRAVGVGPGSVRILTSRFYWAGTIPAHNDYLRILIEYGAFGLALYLLLVCVLVILAYRTWRWSTDKVMRSIALSFLGVALAFPVMNLTDNLFGQTQNQLFFWTLAGLTVAINRIPARQETRSSPSVPQRVGQLATTRALE